VERRGGPAVARVVEEEEDKRLDRRSGFGGKGRYGSLKLAGGVVYKWVMGYKSWVKKREKREKRKGGNIRTTEFNRRGE
jgi:hypothetical protein